MSFFRKIFVLTPVRSHGLSHAYDRPMHGARLLVACFIFALFLPHGSSVFAARPWVAPLPNAARSTAGPLLPVTLSPLEQELFADAADGQLDEHSLLWAALVAGGATDRAKIEQYEQHVNGLVERWRETSAPTGSPRWRAQAVFEWMHNGFLHGGYRLDATDLAIVIETGKFNCVSASVLYCYLAEQFGLEAHGLELPGHAMSRLYFGKTTIDVESTCPRWFRLTEDPQSRAELTAKAAGKRPGETLNPEERREVSGAALVATVYYNRGVDLLREKHFGQAVVANTKALWLDPSSKTAHGNLLATLNNWAIDEGASGHYNEAVGLLRVGLALQPDFRPFHVNFVHVHRQWSEALCREGRFEQSRDVLLAGRRELSDEPWFDEALKNIHRQVALTEQAKSASPGYETLIKWNWPGVSFVSDSTNEMPFENFDLGSSL